MPYVIYSATETQWGDVRALLASSVPPIVWSIIEVVRKGRIDVVSLFVILSIALSLLAFAGGGSARFLQLRENFVTGAFGLAFLISALIGKPLIWQFAIENMRRKSAAEAEAFERRSGEAGVRRTMNLMTIVWGVGLLAQTALACALLFVLSIATYLIVSPILAYGTLGGLGAWTWWYVRRIRAKYPDQPATSAEIAVPEATDG